MLKLKVVHIRGPLNPHLTLLSTDVVTRPTIRGLNQPLPVGNRVKRTRPIQASPSYHSQIGTSLPQDLQSFLFISFRWAWLVSPPRLSHTHSHHSGRFCRILSTNYKSFCTVNY